MRKANLRRNLLIYFCLSLVGLAVLALASQLQVYDLPDNQQYHYSELFRNNLTLPVKIIFPVIAFIVVYFFRLNPWLTGLALFLVYPVTSIVEGAVYRGSHNLLPFEFVFHFFFALPSIAAGFIAKLIHYYRDRQKAAVQ